MKIERTRSALKAGGGVLVPEVSFEPSRGVVILIQQNICGGRCPSDNPKDMPAFTYRFSPPPSKLDLYITHTARNGVTPCVQVNDCQKIAHAAFVVLVDFSTFVNFDMVRRLCCY